MKKLAYNILVALLLLSVGAVANDNVFVRKIEPKTYQVNKNTLFEIIHKFGNIDIENTDDNSITIEAEIEIKNASQSKANDIFDKININSSKTGNTVKAITEFEQMKLRNIKLEINYKVKMPKYLRINLQNKYGNVFINQLANKSNIYVKYGSLSLNSLQDNSDKPLSVIELKYCDNSEIDEFNWGKLIVSYSDITINKGKAVIVLSKYSDVNVSNFSSVVAEVYGCDRK